MNPFLCAFLFALTFSESALAVYKLDGARAQRLFSDLSSSGARVVNNGPHQRTTVDTLLCLAGRKTSGESFHSCTFNSSGTRGSAPTEALAIAIASHVNAAGLASEPHNGLLILRAKTVGCSKLATTTPGRFNWSCGIEK